MFTIDGKKYADEIGESEDFLEPIPQCALASGGERVTDFQIMQPVAPGVFEANFEMDANRIIHAALVRYGNFRPCEFRFDSPRYLIKSDSLTIDSTTS